MFYLCCFVVVPLLFCPCFVVFNFKFELLGRCFAPVFFWLKHLKVALFLVPLSHRETSPEKVKADCRPSPFPTSFLQVKVAPNLGPHLRRFWETRKYHKKCVGAWPHMRRRVAAAKFCVIWFSFSSCKVFARGTSLGT